MKCSSIHCRPGRLCSGCQRPSPQGWRRAANCARICGCGRCRVTSTRASRCCGRLSGTPALQRTPCGALHRIDPAGAAVLEQQVLPESGIPEGIVPCGHHGPVALYKRGAVCRACIRAKRHQAAESVIWRGQGGGRRRRAQTIRPVVGSAGGRCPLGIPPQLARSAWGRPCSLTGRRVLHRQRCVLIDDFQAHSLPSASRAFSFKIPATVCRPGSRPDITRW